MEAVLYLGLYLSTTTSGGLAVCGGLRHFLIGYLKKSSALEQQRPHLLTQDDASVSKGD